MSDDELLPLSAEQEATGFDVVLRGYDRRQVEDYVERVEVAMLDAERQHAEDGERLAALEHEVGLLQARLEDAEKRAAGLPEPASRVGERLATMLRLAEEEAEQLVAQARERAVASTSERTADLDRREERVRETEAAAEQLRLDAQRDAEAVRARAQQEAAALEADARREADTTVGQARQQAEALLREAREHADALVGEARQQADAKRQTAEEDVAILHEDARRQAADLVAGAERQVAALAEQRDTIAAQLQSLRETLSAAVQPLHPPRADGA